MDGSDRSGADGITRIVEVGAKPETERVATAEAWLITTPEAAAELVAGTTKGSPIESAKLAGLSGVKRTPDLLPHCHPIRVTGVEVAIEPDAQTGRINIRTTVRAVDRTGVEMEALTVGSRGGPLALRHREGVRPLRPDRGDPAAREVGREERGLPGRSLSGANPYPPPTNGGRPEAVRTASYGKHIDVLREHQMWCYRAVPA